MKSCVMSGITIAILGLAGAPGAMAKDPVAQGILRIAAPFQRKLADTLKTDKPLERDLQRYQSSMQRIARDTSLSFKERDALLRELGRRHEPAFRKWFDRSAVNEADYRLSVARYFRRLEADGKRKYAIRYTGFLSLLWKRVPVNPTPMPSDREIVVDTFTFVERQVNGPGDVEADRVRGQYSVESVILVAGGFENIGGLGHFLQMDDRYDRIEVSAALPESSFDVSSASALLGASGASAKSRVEVLSNNEIVCVEEVEHASVIAPALWYAGSDGRDNVVVSCQFDAPGIGDEIVMRYLAVTGVWAVGASVSTSWVRATPRDIRIRLKY